MAVVHLFAVGDMHFLKNDFADLALDLCVLSHPYGEGTRQFQKENLTQKNPIAAASAIATHHGGCFL